MGNFANFFETTPTGALIILGLSLIIFIIILFYLSIRLTKSIQAAALNNGRTNQYLAAVPADRIGTVNAVYQNTRKQLSTAMILCLVGGTFGLQRAYLGSLPCRCFCFSGQVSRPSSHCLILWTCRKSFLNLISV